MLSLAGYVSAQPNIILIMTDDMGYSDLGCYGGEVNTPHLDKLAEEGLRFTQFYNTGRCCPTRVSLMSGLYPHQAGMGHMTRDEGEEHPGYRGRLMERAVTIAEVLGDNGYDTIHTGKWHLGNNPGPEQRGFDWCSTNQAGPLQHFDATFVRNRKRFETKGYREDIFFDEAMTLVFKASL